MFKEEFKSGIITLKGTGINRQAVVLQNNDGTSVTLLEGNYDWGYPSQRSNNLAYDILIRMLDDVETVKKIASTFQAVVINNLNPLKFYVKIHVSDLISSMGYTNIPLSNKSSVGELKHAFSFIKIHIGETINNDSPLKRDVFVSKFLDFSETASTQTIYQHGTVQYELYSSLDYYEKRMLGNYMLEQRKGDLVNGGVSKVGVTIEEHWNEKEVKDKRIIVNNGSRLPSEAEKLIYKYDSIYSPEW